MFQRNHGCICLSVCARPTARTCIPAGSADCAVYLQARCVLRARRRDFLLSRVVFLVITRFFQPSAPSSLSLPRILSLFLICLVLTYTLQAHGASYTLTAAILVSESSKASLVHILGFTLAARTVKLRASTLRDGCLRTLLKTSSPRLCTCIRLCFCSCHRDLLVAALPIGNDASFFCVFR